MSNRSIGSQEIALALRGAYSPEPMTLDSMKWTLAEGDYEGQPLRIRFRQVSADFPRDTFPSRINVFWTMADPDRQGLPTDSEHARLATFEERLVSAVEADEHSVLSVVLTCGGKREWVFHTADVAQFLSRLTNMPQENERYPIELVRNHDPAWTYDESVLPVASESGSPDGKM